ncbi:MAG TPA: hypothetical protein VKE22_26145 [Haliangiales bacterium]|nr:hypothetical protein [Haliangiales bacterium]
MRTFAAGKGPGGEDFRAVNVRCLEGLDVDRLQVRRFDGRSL